MAMNSATNPAAINSAMPTRAKPWWKEPWPWIVIALPGSMVVIGFLLLGIAVKHGDDVVNAHPYERGLAVGQVIMKAREARAMHLQGNLSAKDGVITLRLPDAVNDATIELHLEHPFRARFDINTVLHRVAPGIYEAKAPLQDVQYQAQVQTGTWSLSGRWQPSGKGLLQPGESELPGVAPLDQ